MSKQRKTKCLKNLNHGLKEWNTMTRDNIFYSTFYVEDPRKFRRRFMPVIGGDLIAGCLSIGMVTVLVGLTYLSTFPIDFATQVSFIGGVGIGAVFGLAKYEVLYGRIYWVWLNVAIYLICLLVTLPTITYTPNIYLYCMSLLGPLIGLLILNSNRCRELHHKMVEIRHKREAIIITLKQQGKWKWW
ncbi:MULTISPECIES: hypothetical protein [unclassified Pseudomonas]|uniref:hypothetical protein n=1 Tax=unclassified Pseudomonas TaxID=196821 RepID=UPI0030DAE29B